VAVEWEQFGNTGRGTFADGSRYQRTNDGAADWEDLVRVQYNTGCEN
jgi:hypothetical protein